MEFYQNSLAATVFWLVRDELTELDTANLYQPFTLRQLLRYEADLDDYGELVEYHTAAKHAEYPAQQENHADAEFRKVTR